MTMGYYKSTVVKNARNTFYCVCHLPLCNSFVAPPVEKSCLHPWMVANRSRLGRYCIHGGLPEGVLMFQVADCMLEL